MEYGDPAIHTPALPAGDSPEPSIERRLPNEIKNHDPDVHDLAKPAGDSTESGVIKVCLHEAF